MTVATDVEKHVAVIFTALPVEYNAVRSHLKFLGEKVHQQGTIYEQGIFSSNGQSWDVGIAEVGEGNEQAAVEVERAIQYFKPRIILFVGVAGGVKDVKLGDIVVATKVYGYESGKAGETFRPRPEVGSPNYKLINRARAEAKKDDWLQRLGELIPDPHPVVFVKPIAAGSKMINSTRSAVYEFIKSYYEDTLAVEMEGYGFLKAAYANPDVYALVIRGISDLIDGKEAADKTGTQEKASFHASAFAFEVLAKLYNEPVVSKQHKRPEESSPEKTAVLDKNIEKTEVHEASEKMNIPKAIINKSTDMESIFKPGADLQGVDLRECTMVLVNLNGAIMDNANLSGVNLMESKLVETKLVGAHLEGANLKKADLRGANLAGAFMEDADLRGANLRGAYLEDVDLKGASMRNANLKGAYLEDADLTGADLTRAILMETEFKRTNLERANLIGARDLTFDQLSQVKTLYSAKLDEELLTPLKDKYPKLFENPDYE